MEMFKDNPYPRMLFGEGGKQLQVNNVGELNTALADGWREQYTYQDYPKMVCGADGVKVRCNNAAEESAVIGGEPEAKPEANPEGRGRGRGRGR